MTLRYKKEDYEWMAMKRRVALQNIANELGGKHEIVKLMGNLTYGRSNFEHGPDYGLQDAVREMSALDGVFDVLNRWALMHDQKAQRVLLKHYPRSFQEHGKS
jgi:calcineurin-like phosphoesterase family protein